MPVSLLLLQKVTFDAGPQLQFLFHSDSSNNEWGYKFAVTALGLPDFTISWISDLQLLVARLMGRLASRTLAMKSPYGETSCIHEEATENRHKILIEQNIVIGLFAA